MKSRINTINDSLILFDNGTAITFDHSANCCKWNYANFAAVDPEALSYDFDMNHLTFEACDDGFRFGDHPVRMFFVPCYSEQNGYYSVDIDIYLNDEKVLTTECEEIPF